MRTMGTTSCTQNTVWGGTSTENCLTDPTDDPSMDNCIIGCTPGYGGNGAGVGTHGGGGGCLSDPASCVSLIPPAPGDACDGSQLTLGSQWPVNTTDSGHEVKDIIAMSANNAADVPEIAGWEYLTPDGGYIQGNPSMKTFWTSLAESIPTIGSLIQNLDSGGIVSANSSQASQITNYIRGHNGKAGSCFTHALA